MLVKQDYIQALNEYGRDSEITKQLADTLKAYSDKLKSASERLTNAG